MFHPFSSKFRSEYLALALVYFVYWYFQMGGRNLIENCIFHPWVNNTVSSKNTYFSCVAYIASILILSRLESRSEQTVYFLHEQCSAL